MSSRRRPVRYCFVTTLARNLEYFYAGSVVSLARDGVVVHGVSSPGDGHEQMRALGMTTHEVSIAREPRPLRDIISTLRLIRFFLRHRFALIVVSTPKAALLGAIAASMAGQRRRVVYVIRGRAYENAFGWRRRMLAAMDRLACRLSVAVICIGRDLCEALVRDRICAREKVRLFANGSSKGVDVRQFSRTRTGMDRASARVAVGIPFDATVVGYVGWLRSEKGTGELIEAVREVRVGDSSVHLLLAGTFEDQRDPVGEPARSTAVRSEWVHVVPWMADPAHAYAAMDIFAFPTHREGFGSVALEAASMELPVVASDIPGVREAVAFGSTAIAVPPNDPSRLAAALTGLVEDPGLRESLGRAGRARVVECFSAEYVIEEFVAVLNGCAAQTEVRDA